MRSNSRAKKRKPPSTAKLKNKAAELLQKLVKMKAADSEGICQCVTCGRRASWKEMDGGHFIGRRWTAHLLNETNIHPQCKTCNRFFSGCHDDYRAWMVREYGESYVNWLSDTKRHPVKYSSGELLVLIDHLKTQIKEQEARIGHF